LDKADSFHPEIILSDIGLLGQLDEYGVARAFRYTPCLEKIYPMARTGFGSVGNRDKAWMPVSICTWASRRSQSHWRRSSFRCLIEGSDDLLQIPD